MNEYLKELKINYLIKKGEYGKLTTEILNGNHSDSKKTVFLIRM